MTAGHLSRRRFVAGIAVAPVLPAEALASPSPDAAVGANIKDGVANLATQESFSQSTAAALSDIGRACQWACRHREWMEQAVRIEVWDDARLDAEIDRVDAVFRRAAAEPSQSLADLSAKARLVLPDLLDSMADIYDFPDGLLSIVVLRELAALFPERGAAVP